MIEEVGGTIEWAKNKLDSLPKAKRELGPLLDALGQPLTQIVGGVGLLLAGVLNLVSKLVCPTFDLLYISCADPRRPALRSRSRQLAQGSLCCDGS